jgi:hypothetical protein
MSETQEDLGEVERPEWLAEEKRRRSDRRWRAADRPPVVVIEDAAG